MMLTIEYQVTKVKINPEFLMISYVSAAVYYASYFFVTINLHITLTYSKQFI